MMTIQYNGYRISPGGKAAGAWRLPSTSYSAEVKESVELLYSPSGLPWPAVGLAVALHFIEQKDGNRNKDGED